MSMHCRCPNTDLTGLVGDSSSSQRASPADQTADVLCKPGYMLMSALDSSIHQPHVVVPTNLVKT